MKSVHISTLSRAIRLFALALLACSKLTFAQTTVNLAQTPLLALKTAPGLVMLTMSRDQRLFYSAYPDGVDMNGDGTLDVGFNPNNTYYGYFASDRCYAYDTTVTPVRFVPKSMASSSTGCSTSAGRWHGNWLNWIATTRMDALRKVLYGGKRVTDTNTLTVLEAAHIPPDAHIWGREYRPVSVLGSTAGVDNYDIRNFTPLSMPGANQQHLFMMKSEGTSTSPFIGTGVPTIRIVQNVDASIDRVWLWASSERPVGGPAGTTQYSRPSGYLNNTTGGLYNLPGFGSGTSYSSKNFTYNYQMFVRVEACTSLSPGGRESNCTGYPSSSPTIWKPTGLLHDYSVNDQLKFGLLTGSYTNNYSGGVVRKDIGTFTDEFSASTGIFTSVNGIVKGINAITTYGFDISSQTYVSNSTNAVCPSNVFEWNRTRCEGEVNMWGAPVAEMMYEGLRYFAGKQPTSAFTNNVSSSSSPDSQIGLPLVSTWSNPFRASGGSPMCSKPVQMVISDPITSFDSDQLPGAAFTPATGYGAAIGATDLTGLNVGLEADTIWTAEFGGSRNVFFGQTTASNADGNPSAKSSSSFKYMRGHAPDETNTQGSYYSASVARFGKKTGITITNGSTTANATPVDTVSVALGSVIPQLTITYQGKKATIIPVTKSVAGCSNAPSSAPAAPNGFQPTGLITGIFIDKLANTGTADQNSSINGGRPYARFMVSFSDMDVGGDNEADANAYYTVYINSLGKLVVQIDNYYQATCSEQHYGYAIAGTTKDGIYLELRGINTGTGTVYYLDTLPGQFPYPDNTGTPARSATQAKLSTSGANRTFDFATGSAAAAAATYVPHDTLWYAAKYGGAGVTDINGDPTNYFKVTNAANLPAQLGKAFRAAAAIAAVSSTSVVGTGQRSSGTAAVYQADYDSLTWTSRFYAFDVATNGAVSNTPLWEAASMLGTASSRKLFLGRGGTSTPFNLSTGTFSSLTAGEQTDFGDAGIYAYLLGDKSGEERKGGTYRNRGAAGPTDVGSVLGDVIDSDPQVIGKKDYGYGSVDSTYTTFLGTITTESLAFGANDGFFHVFDASRNKPPGGNELLGFMPQAARAGIKDLASTAYQHRYFVDGPVGLGHAKISVPGDASVNWRSVAVGTGGAGAQTVFAVNTTSQTYTSNSILWEINGNTTLPVASTLGNVSGRPIIGQLRYIDTVTGEGTWVAIFGNGYNSGTGNAYLFVVRLRDGTILKEISTSTSIGSNGLISVQPVVNTSTKKIDYVYGADFKGNIWRFDLTSSSIGSWPTTGARVYSTPTGRPITAELQIGAPPSTKTGGYMVYFGTGSYLSASDPTVTTVQAMYGIYDDLLWTDNVNVGISESQLDSQTLTVSSSTADTRTTSTPSPTWYSGSKKGWVLQLTGTNVVPGERVIAPPVRYTVAGKVDAIIFTSIVPGTDPCNASIDTWITAIDALSGGASKAFDGLTANSVKIGGGSPRGVFVLQDGGDPTLYISQTIFNGSAPTTSFGTISGGDQTVNIGGVSGETRILGIKLTKPTPTSSVVRQVWRQLK